MSVLARAADVDRLVAQRSGMEQALEELVGVDTPTSEPRTLARGAAAVAAQGARLLGREPMRLEREGIVHLRWGPARPRVLLLGHYDTVFPPGTPDRRPPEIRGDRLYGPGAFDMKAGIVQGWFALRALGFPDDVAMLLNGDEERGSPSSSALVEEHAAGAAAVLVLEPSAAGALKIARHGVTQYRLTVRGRAAHAGLDAARGVNALVELAHQIERAVAHAAERDDVILTPGVARAGDAPNVVPELATCTFDVRARTLDAQREVAARFGDLAPRDPRAALAVETLASCPPLEAARSSELLALAERVARDLGLPALRGVAVGGGSDGNRTAALGIPTLDGLGAVGDGAHAADEHVELAEMPRRAALVAGLIAALSDASGGQPRAAAAAPRRAARPDRRA